MCVKYKVLKHPGLTALALFGLFTVQSANAVNISFSGTLISGPKCVMTTSPIAIDFGQVAMEGVNYSGSELYRLVTYTPSCTNTQSSSKYAVRLIFGGVEASGNPKVLATSISSLGILMSDALGTPLVLNEPYVVKDLNLWPTLRVRPIQVGMFVTPGGAFTANGTLTIDVI